LNPETTLTEAKKVLKDLKLLLLEIEKKRVLMDFLLGKKIEKRKILKEKKVMK
jgi:hypothetical protein